MKCCLLKHPLLRAYCSFLRIFVLRAFPNYSATSLLYAPSIGRVGEDEFLKKVYEITKKKCDVALQLFKEVNWDFFMFAVYYTDPIQHSFWKYMDEKYLLYIPNDKYKNVILQYYQFIDKYLSRFLSKLPKNTIVMLVSDHGHGPLYKKVDLNAWFEENDLFKVKKGRKIHKKKIMDILYQLRLLNILIKLRSFTIFKKVTNKVEDTISVLPIEVDWRKTRVFSFNRSAIYINLKGREPEGIVEPGKEYEEVREEIIKKLKELKDPETGLNIIQKAWKREDIYFGPHVESLPDIVVQFRDESKYFSKMLGAFSTGNIFELLPGSEHTSRGIFLAWGPDIKKGVKIENCRIMDVAPTILHIYGLPIPRDIDGRVLKEIFKEDSELAERQVIYQKMDEKERVGYKIKRLKSLRKI